ncbi:RluA family pseudouridine synthase [Phocaeicola oris]|uniref:RluA family pseudouridine synthase n=1 Tax=Phocaeicola oris TaxID=2896850 RepID=UPI00234E5E4E|nr:RluA family pseudouridine synthase [Phocaeicola oris]MCE2617492.1 RluA family pseudouridine synthase [Phocaeicola oris]
MEQKRKLKEKSDKPFAKAAAKYTIYNVHEENELMPFLMKVMNGISRTKVKNLLTNRVILVDNVIVTQYNFRLKPGMKVQISHAKNNREFRNPLLKLVYEDAYLIVVEKKEGLLSVGTESQRERTAQHILNEYVRSEHSGNRIHVVHRLDRETSGLMMYAKDEKTQHTLRDNWHEIVYDRRYVAVVEGSMEEERGIVRSWLTDHKLYVSSSLVDDGGKFSVTHYQTIKRNSRFSLMELHLDTGRKNQIRVHMAQLGHPVVGDSRYGSEIDPLGRLALHAFKLCFTHPVTGERMEFETPYPKSFKDLML